MRIRMNGNEWEGTITEILKGLRQDAWAIITDDPLDEYLDFMHKNYFNMTGETLDFGGILEENAKTLFDALNKIGVLEYREHNIDALKACADKQYNPMEAYSPQQIEELLDSENWYLRRCVMEHVEVTPQNGEIILNALLKERNIDVLRAFIDRQDDSAITFSPRQIKSLIRSEALCVREYIGKSVMEFLQGVLSDKETLYLAYGSNCNMKQMVLRCAGAEMVGKAKLEGYRLAYRRGFLTVPEDEGQSTACAVWRLTEQDEQSLDRYEGYPRFYDKKTVRVILSRTVFLTRKFSNKKLKQCCFIGTN